MSLVVWLPLNGDLTNRGLSNVTVTNNGATVDNNGKIGKCYSFGSSKRITISQPANLFPTQVSLSCWVNLSSWASSYDSLINLSTGTGWNDTRLAFVRNNTSNRICFCIANGSTFNTVVMTADLPLNTWTHLTGTFDGNTIKIYVNGILNNSMTTTFNSIIYSSAVLNIGSWSNGNNYPINGKLNDVRLYNHCLSAKEVKDLAKGLVLHYRLAGPGQENLLADSLDLSKWDNLSGKSELQPDGFYKATYSGGGWWGPRKAINLTAGVKYIASCLARGTRAQLWIYHNVSGGNDAGSIIVNSSTPQHISVTFTPAVTGSYYVVGYASNTSDTFFYKDMKLEKGLIATPWCPNSADPLYHTMGYDNNIEYDCSGYRRNGIKSGTIIWDVNSPRYTTSYHFSNSQYINYTENFTFLTTGSISFWAKFNTKGSAGWLPFTGQDGSHFVMATSGGSGNFYEGTTPAVGTIKYYEDSKTVLAPTNDGKWHHYAITGINMSSWTVFKINNYPNTIWNSDVNYSDIRIYNTVLSAEDIAELYHSAVIVDNTGKNYAYEYFEA